MAQLRDLVWTPLTLGAALASPIMQASAQHSQRWTTDGQIVSPEQ
jgi:hypothetical protein